MDAVAKTISIMAEGNSGISGEGIGVAIDVGVGLIVGLFVAGGAVTIGVGVAVEIGCGVGVAVKVGCGVGESSIGSAIEGKGFGIDLAIYCIAESGT